MQMMEYEMPGVYLICGVRDAVSNGMDCPYLLKNPCFFWTLHTGLPLGFSGSVSEPLHATCGSFYSKRRYLALDMRASACLSHGELLNMKQSNHPMHCGRGPGHFASRGISCKSLSALHAAWLLNQCDPSILLKE